jgi:uncharacterized protein with PQ loop repeat
MRHVPKHRGEVKSARPGPYGWTDGPAWEGHGFLRHDDSAVMTTPVMTTPVLSAVSRVVGLLIVLGSAFVSVPQIVTVYRARSARGLSVTTLIASQIGHMINVHYAEQQGYHLSTFGEGVFQCIQNMVLLMMIAAYEHSTVKPILVSQAVIYLATVTLLWSSSATRLATLQLSTVVVFACCRLPQIWGNWRAGHTGQLSLLTSVLTLIGTLGRVFTTYTELGDDPYLMYGALTSLVCSVTLFLQIVVYRKWNRHA